MSLKKSDLIIPISICIHLGIINSVLYYLTPQTYLNPVAFSYYNISWLLIALCLDFYPTRRNEHFFTNIRKMFYMYLIYGLAYFASFGFMDNLEETSMKYQLFVFSLLCLFFFIYRVLFYMARRRYRLEGGNFVNVVVIGRDKNLKKVRRVFDDPYLGYRYKGFFDDKPSKSPTYLGNIIDCFGYILENGIDEMYCIASRLSKKELQNLINFADNNLIKIKIIPDNKEIFTRAMFIQMYDSIPVLNLRRVPLDVGYARFIKRTFDLVFSTLVIVFILSWLTPLLYLLIRWESPGPLFFKQKRHGLKRRVFWCYKFRSMTCNAEAHTKMTVKNDSRITHIGRLLRKTSMDELPQFFNVFLGDMSVVGPRPHMEIHTNNYQNSVDKYLVRHFVKPGITGLAQIMGYRGEIIRPSDIRNRTRLDIFYVEKWSLFMDIRIIFQTIENSIMGEPKAY